MGGEVPEKREQEARSFGCHLQLVPNPKTTKLDKPKKSIQTQIDRMRLYLKKVHWRSCVHRRYFYTKKLLPEA